MKGDLTEWRSHGLCRSRTTRSSHGLPMRRTFEPNEIETHTGITPDRLRDWRRRKLLTDIGTEKPSGRWIYSPSDVFILACSRWLEVAGFGRDLSAAIAISVAIMPQVWEFIADTRSGRASAGKPRFMIIPPSGPGSARWTVDFPTADATQGAPAFLVIDCLLIADDLTSRLGDIVAGVETGWSAE